MFKKLFKKENIDIENLVDIEDNNVVFDEENIELEDLDNIEEDIDDFLYVDGNISLYGYDISQEEYLIFESEDILLNYFLSASVEYTKGLERGEFFDSTFRLESYEIESIQEFLYENTIELEEEDFCKEYDMLKLKLNLYGLDEDFDVVEFFGKVEEIIEKLTEIINNEIVSFTELQISKFS